MRDVADAVQVEAGVEHVVAAAKVEFEVVGVNVVQGDTHLQNLGPIIIY